MFIDNKEIKFIPSMVSPSIMFSQHYDRQSLFSSNNSVVKTYLGKNCARWST